MIDATSVYLDVSDATAEEQNGSITYNRFNRYSRLAELRLIDYLSGDVAGVQPPEPYLTQKNSDWLSPIIATYQSQTINGKISKPSDYYGYGNMWVVGSYRDDLCATPAKITGDNTPIEIVESAEFDDRCNSYIEGIKPSLKKPIVKMVGDEFVFAPADLGVVVLEYKKIPVFGELGIKMDEVYNEEIIDPATTKNYLWGEQVRGLLTWFIMQKYPIRNREDAFVQQIQAEGKSPRG